MRGRLSGAELLCIIMKKIFHFFVGKVSSPLIAILGEKCFLPKRRAGLHAPFKHYDLSLRRRERVFLLGSGHGAQPACFYLELETRPRLFLSHSLSRNEGIRRGESSGVGCFAFGSSRVVEAQSPVQGGISSV